MHDTPITHQMNGKQQMNETTYKYKKKDIENTYGRKTTYERQKTDEWKAKESKKHMTTNYQKTYERTKEQMDEHVHMNTYTHE